MQGGFAKTAKTQFSHVYDCIDCRPYYCALQSLNYQLPDHVSSLVRQSLSELQRQCCLRRCVVLDVASGYGALSARLRHDISMESLLSRYLDPDIRQLTPEELVESDREWFCKHRASMEWPHVIGLDTSIPALEYGKSVGLYDAVFSEDLESFQPTPELSAAVSQVDLIMESGGIGYIGPNTFERLLACCTEPKPWVIMAPTRVSNATPVLNCLRNHGYSISSPSDSPVKHRLFSDSTELDKAVAEIGAKGLNPESYESSGYYFADLYIAKPMESV